MKKLIIYLLLIIVFVGCGEKEKPQTTLRSADINIEIINLEQLQNIISERNNKPLFINFWATWCPPCVEEFPDIVKLSEEKGNEVEFIAVSLDSESDLQNKVKSFVQKNNVNFKVLLLKESDVYPLMDWINDEWRGAIPVTFIYDKNGNQVNFLLGLQSYSQFETAINKVL